jgi:TrpR-related protein YerC/YecD
MAVKLDPTSDIAELAKAINRLRTVEETASFLLDLLTPGEVGNLVGRWRAVQMLSSKQNYLDIQKQTGLSTATIAKMSNAMKYGTGTFAKIIDRLN